MYSEWAHAHRKGRIKKLRQKENKSAGQQIKTSLLETVVNRISKRFHLERNTPKQQNKTHLQAAPFID